MSNAPKYLVPHDFSAVADNALKHAVKVAESSKATVLLLHVVAKPAQVEEARTKLNKLAEEFGNENVKIEPLVRIGNIFEDIPNVADEHNVKLNFMGTHGAKGWQKIVGSDALKVITNSVAPFIVVQEKGIQENGYDDIVVPLDLDKATKQKLVIVAEMAKYFNSRIHIILPNETDEFLVHQLNSNIIFAKKFLTEKGISFKTKVAEGSFDKEVIRYAATIEADLIAIMNMQGNRIGGNLLANSSEQMLITNDAEIPVAIINPQSMGESGSILFS
jgi:nucleotide-binding universal stress UspA family protein